MTTIGYGDFYPNNDEAKNRIQPHDQSIAVSTVTIYNMVRATRAHITHKSQPRHAGLCRAYAYPALYPENTRSSRIR